MRIPSILFAVFAILFLLLFSFLGLDSDQPTPNDLEDFDVRLVAAPASLENTSLDVKYLGTEACIDCHKENYASYLRTTHSRAAQLTSPTTEPDAGSFHNEVTGSDFEALFRDGKLIHRELRKSFDGQRAGTTEVQIDFSIGSGTRGKSYVFQQDSFWKQSPISWFHKTGKWGMSPGYEGPFHSSFSRKLDSSCFFCHVGSVDLMDGNPNRFEVHEVTIGCERCHGPGEVHVKKHSQIVDTKLPDNTIANPARLSRELSEAVCQQCHLMGATDAMVSGKSLWDFRPGLNWTDFRIDFQHRVDNGSMNAVGHVPQMHASQCYQQTDTLTCITCHDPHNVPNEDSKVDFYRSICLNCHDDHSCGKPVDERIVSNGNDCASCHMPLSATNVPHTALRNHQIGIFDDTEKELPGRDVTLVPILETSRLSKDELDRCEALAKVHLLAGNSDPRFAAFADEAILALLRLKQAGKDDATTTAALVTLAQLQGQQEFALKFAKEVREMDASPTNGRIDATRILAEAAFKSRAFDKAVELYRELAANSQDPLDIYYLGLSENNVGNAEEAVAALQRSLELDPTQQRAHRALQAIYQAKGNIAEAEKHAEAADENAAIFQKLSDTAETMEKK